MSAAGIVDHADSILMLGSSLDATKNAKANTSNSVMNDMMV